MMMMNVQFINTNKGYIEQERERKRRQRLPCKQAKGPATEVAVYTCECGEKGKIQEQEREHRRAEEHETRAEEKSQRRLRDTTAVGREEHQTRAEKNNSSEAQASVWDDVAKRQVAAQMSVTQKGKRGKSRKVESTQSGGVSAGEECQHARHTCIAVAPADITTATGWDEVCGAAVCV